LPYRSPESAGDSVKLRTLGYKRGRRGSIRRSVHFFSGTLYLTIRNVLLRGLVSENVVKSSKSSCYTHRGSANRCPCQTVASFFCSGGSVFCRAARSWPGGSRLSMIHELLILGGDGIGSRQLRRRQPRSRYSLWRYLVQNSAPSFKLVLLMTRWRPK
jgi:hypothetical protein